MKVRNNNNATRTRLIESSIEVSGIHANIAINVHEGISIALFRAALGSDIYVHSSVFDNAQASKSNR